MSVAGILPVVADKPGGDPAPTEPTGTLVLTDNLQLLAVASDYARLYDWDPDTDQFVHSWSAKADHDGVIGDIDGDDSKEVAALRTSSVTTGKKPHTTTTWSVYLNVWEDGDDSASPSLSQKISTEMAWQLDIGDVDGDGDGELVVQYSDAVEVWDFTADADGQIASSTTSYTARVEVDSYFGLEIGDADFDGVNEIVVGEAGEDNTAAVIDRSGTGTFSIAAYIGSSVIDDISIGNLDGNTGNGNEIFMSGATGGKVFIWRYVDSAYSQVWTGTYDTSDNGVEYLQSNKEVQLDSDAALEVVSGRGTGYVRDGGKLVWQSRMYVWQYDGYDSWTLSTNDLSGYSVGQQINNCVAGDVDDDDANEVILDGVVFEWTDGTLQPIQVISDHSLALYHLA